jgi:hypothetical protein
VDFSPHIFSGERAPSLSDEMDIHFCSIGPDDRHLMWKIES